MFFLSLYKYNIIFLKGCLLFDIGDSKGGHFDYIYKGEFELCCKQVSNKKKIQQNGCSTEGLYI